MGFALVTAIRGSTVSGSGAPVSTTWQGVQKKSSSSDCFFVIPTHLIWNHLRHFEHRTQTILPEGLQHFWAEQNLLMPLRDISEPTIYGSGTAHDTCYNAHFHFQSGDKTTKNDYGEKQGKTGLGVSKAIEKSGDLLS